MSTKIVIKQVKYYKVPWDKKICPIMSIIISNDVYIMELFLSKV